MQGGVKALAGRPDFNPAIAITFCRAEQR